MKPEQEQFTFSDIKTMEIVFIAIGTKQEILNWISEHPETFMEYSGTIMIKQGNAFRFIAAMRTK